MALHEYKPDLEIEVTLWRRGQSTGTLTLGLGINSDSRQLLFYIGNVEADSKPDWWLVAERHMFMLDFFLENKVYFDGQLERSGWTDRRTDTVQIHFMPDDYDRFIDILGERLNALRSVGLPRIASKKMYALVELMILFASQMDIDDNMDENAFYEKWGYLAGLLKRARE